MMAPSFATIKSAIWKTRTYFFYQADSQVLKMWSHFSWFPGEKPQDKQIPSIDKREEDSFARFFQFPDEDRVAQDKPQELKCLDPLLQAMF